MKIFSKNKNKTKAPLTKKQKQKRIIICAVAVLCALVAAGSAVWFSVVKAPKVNNHTITDTVNGDALNLDMGDRVADYFTFFIGAVDIDETRTDAMMVCGFNTKTKQIDILNIPRDTMSDVARKGAAKKINAAYGTSKGIEQTKAEVKKLIGFSPDYHIIVNFQGIADIVDAIGGVDYEVPFRMYYQDPSQDLSIDFQPGMQHMDGGQVVEFLRWRKNNGGVKTGDPNYTGGDEERIDKQQEFLQYLATQVLDLKNTSKIPQIAKAVFDNVKTDFTWGEMLWMSMQSLGTSSENIRMHKLPGYDAMSYAGTSWLGSFFFPKEEETLTLINTYFNPYTEKLTSLDIVSGPDRQSSSSSSSSGSSHSSSSSSKDSQSNSSSNSTTTQTPDTTTPDTSQGDSSQGTTDGNTSTGTTTPPTDDTTTPPTSGDNTTGGTTGGSTGGTTGGTTDSGSTGTTTPGTSTGGTTDGTTTIPPSANTDPEA